MPPEPRRHPRYEVFLLTGGVIGLVADVVVILGPGADAPSPGRLFLYLGLLMVGTGALLGGLLAVLIEGRLPPSLPDAPMSATQGATEGASDAATGDAPRTTADP